MLSFFKKKHKKKPHKKGHSFYDRENLIQTIEELNHVLSYLGSSDCTKTNSEILFQGKQLDSINKKDLEKKFGEESFILEANNIFPNHEVYYYRITSEHLKFLIQLHFVKDQFFFAATKVYAETLMSKKDIQNVIGHIKNKYYPEATEDTMNFSIEDPKGNVLFTRDDIYYYIKYLPNNITNQELQKQFLGYSKPSSVKSLKNTLDDLI